MLREDQDTDAPKKTAVQRERPPIVADWLSEQTCADQDFRRHDRDYIKYVRMAPAPVRSRS